MCEASDTHHPNLPWGTVTERVGEVEYRPRAWLAFVTAMAIMYPVLAVALGIARLNDGEPFLIGLEELLLSGLPAVGPALVFVLAGAGRGWRINTSPEALTLTPPRAGVLQPMQHEIRFGWRELASARSKYRGPWRSLVVRPKTGSPVTVRIAFLRPGPAALLRDLAHRLGDQQPVATRSE